MSTKTLNIAAAATGFLAFLLMASSFAFYCVSYIQPMHQILKSTWFRRLYEIAVSATVFLAFSMVPLVAAIVLKSHNLYTKVGSGITLFLATVLQISLLAETGNVSASSKETAFYMAIVSLLFTLASAGTFAASVIKEKNEKVQTLPQ